MLTNRRRRRLALVPAGAPLRRVCALESMDDLQLRLLGALAADAAEEQRREQRREQEEERARLEAEQSSDDEEEVENLLVGGEDGSGLLNKNDL